jgi:hypothetical protein
MMKRGLSLFLVFMLLISVSFVVAQEDNFGTDDSVPLESEVVVVENLVL